MNTKANKKLCWNCEGNVDKEAVQCLYCGVTLTPSYDDDDDEDAAESKHNYKKASTGIPKAPYAAQNTLDEDLQQLDKNWVNENSIEKTAESHIVSIPFALLLSGIVLFLFSLMLLFFSKEGTLTLKWDSSYWFIYLLIAIPLLIFGWKLLKSPDEES